jgi:hypothetical protein
LDCRFWILDSVWSVPTAFNPTSAIYNPQSFGRGDDADFGLPILDFGFGVERPDGF